MLYWITVIVIGLLFFFLTLLLVPAVLFDRIIKAPKHSKERNKRFLIFLAYLLAVVLLFVLYDHLDSVLSNGIGYM